MHSWNDLFTKWKIYEHIFYSEIFTVYSKHCIGNELPSQYLGVNMPRYKVIYARSLRFMPSSVYYLKMFRVMQVMFRERHRKMTFIENLKTQFITKLFIRGNEGLRIFCRWNIFRLPSNHNSQGRQVHGLGIKMSPFIFSGNYVGQDSSCHRATPLTRMFTSSGKTHRQKSGECDPWWGPPSKLLYWRKSLKIPQVCFVTTCLG